MESVPESLKNVLLVLQKNGRSTRTQTRINASKRSTPQVTHRDAWACACAVCVCCVRIMCVWICVRSPEKSLSLAAPPACMTRRHICIRGLINGKMRADFVCRVSVKKDGKSPTTSPAYHFECAVEGEARLWHFAEWVEQVRVQPVHGVQGDVREEASHKKHLVCVCVCACVCVCE